MPDQYWVYSGRNGILLDTQLLEEYNAGLYQGYLILVGITAGLPNRSDNVAQNVTVVGQTGIIQY